MQAGVCVKCSNSLTTQLEDSGDWRKREIGTGLLCIIRYLEYICV